MPGNPAFHRTELILGEAGMGRLADARVILFGVGGVGSWCAEALVRTGIEHLTIVDSDVICITNLNRQLQTTRANVGKVKVTELAARLGSICPDAQIVPVQEVYNEHTRDSFDIAAYDYVIDAIDSLSYKVDLLATASQADCTVFSAMGAACKLDPTRIRVDSIWNSQGCPLAREVRKRLRRRGVDGDFQCVYSEELLPGSGTHSACGTGECFCPKLRTADGGETAADEWCTKKAQVNGSVAHMTGAFGFFLAGLVVQDVVNRAGDGAGLPD
ncbi:MAG: tRNA threonylcarbamoyladenosine dehydratase [Lentisphaerae bacterium]|jgi:tRNA threonylcarbamoyladenosine dehydratase|nr:tRNA threonylcarbamoyladenosine dehydratase [Lentisphaerota bacterium]MBT4818233.1 tRNA threonylcarbamoyladenosine dehydratase [Lentisphaerota bacterium]MBT5613016.1 tRNA threonylcarbamoyladenosine dehydratase [Lentisphaerota bacterium]MBT7056738.1 tRNA threonylcarbamoyladenosine dehydratase [Lentisphaerota bacterium]MBT7843744.1 tRNA threonylcarbamoyladenosine dehydratase [Lentisphaerota bacterium]